MPPKNMKTDSRQKMLQEANAFEALIEEETGIKISDDRPMKRGDHPPPTPPEKNRKNPDGIVDVITFCEHPYFLNLKLTPWQKIILKLFYSGTEGNTHLKIDNERTETCEHCVWEFNSKSEINYAAAINDAAILTKPQPYMSLENSPCMKCTRMDCAVKKTRFEYEKYQALTKVIVGEIEDLQNVEQIDEYSTEEDLFNADLSEKVRDQVKRKIGRKFQELILVLGRRSGKALSVDTPIITPNGWKTMGDLKVGDCVFGEDGEPTKIIASTDIMENRPCYEIEFSNGDKIMADEQHEWNVFDTKRQKAWYYYKKTHNCVNVLPTNWTNWQPNIGGTNHYSEEENNLILSLKKEKKSNSEISIILNRTEFAVEQQYTKLNKNHNLSDYQKLFTTKELYEKVKNENVSIPLNAPINYHKNDVLPIEPWVLGYLCGDGDTSGLGRVACDARDKNYLIDKFSDLGYIENTNLKHDDIHFSIQNITTAWKNLDLHNGKYIPEIYKQSSIADRIKLLTGLVDSDGYVDNHGAYRFTNTNKQLVDDAKEICHSLGIDTSLSIRKNRKRNNNLCKISYDLIMRSFFPLTTIQRKLEKARHNWKFEQKSNKIKSINKIDSIPMKCIQVSNQSNMYLAGKSMIPTHNSFMVGIIALYEVYRLIMMGHPQARYPLMEFDTITILNVAKSESQAKNAIFDKIRNLSKTSPYFSPYIGKETTLEMYFLTDYDKEENKRRIANGQDILNGTIQLTSGHSNSSTLVGLTVAVIIIDEMAAMVGKASDDGGTDSDLYSMLKPSIATFGQDGKIICISNPLGPNGKFYDLYESSFNLNDVNTLMFQLPTWVSNPHISKAFLSGEQGKDPDNFGMHYGAEFGSSGVSPFLPKESVWTAFDRGAGQKRIEQGVPHQHYFAHLDPSNSSDFYSLVVCHTEPIIGHKNLEGQPLQKVVVDHIHIWRPKGKNFPVNAEYVDQYILDLATKFKFSQISYDQWGSQCSISKLKNYGLNTVCTSFSAHYQNLIFTEMYDLFTSGRIDIYDTDTKILDKNGIMIDVQDATEARQQLLMLQKKWRTNNAFKIEALKGYHDDIPDCIASAAYQALKWKSYNKLPTIRSAYTGNWIR